MSTRNTLSLSLWRPDTTASDINEDDLPRQQLFLQDNSDEDGEDDDKDDVFAYSLSARRTSLHLPENKYGKENLPLSDGGDTNKVYTGDFGEQASDNGILGAKSNDRRMTDIEMDTIDEDTLTACSLHLSTYRPHLRHDPFSLLAMLYHAAELIWQAIGGVEGFDSGDAPSSR
nr:hypothetical protein L204_02806 [Cryptococcus depauperatus CBS 7855]